MSNQVRVVRNLERTWGYRVFCSLDDENKRRKFLSLFETTENKLREVCERGLFLTISEANGVAEILGISMKELLSMKNNDFYGKMVHCRGKFSSQSECEKLLNLIDSYIELEEAANAGSVCKR